MDILLALWSRYLVHIADILLVSVLFYQLLLLIQGTRSVQIATGIVVLAALTILAQLLGLRTFHWLLQRFWLAGMVVIAVVFQPELRSALARLGGKTAPRAGPPRQEMVVVNEIVAAVKESARRQMGMLIAIERDIGLREFIESGTIVNGEVSRDLLVTIFQPPGPLHDGAVIVQGSRIVAAGCILPVSHNESLSKLLGTRHRAALGLSEVSDAWTVCVSEETGTVSTAVDGKLQTGVDPDELREQLLHMYRSTEQPFRSKGRA